MNNDEILIKAKEIKEAKDKERLELANKELTEWATKHNCGLDVRYEYQGDKLPSKPVIQIILNA
jgi:hypothetical protein